MGYIATQSISQTKPTYQTKPKQCLEPMMRLEKRLLPGSKIMSRIFDVTDQTIRRWGEPEDHIFTNVEIMMKGKTKKWVYQPHHVYEGVVNLGYDPENVQVVLQRIAALSDLSAEFRVEVNKLLDAHVKHLCQ